MRLLAVALAVALAGTAAGGFWFARSRSRPPAVRRAVSDGAEPGLRTPAEEQAVRSVVRRGLRTAEDDDLLDSAGREDLDALYGEYHPYFVRGDLDGDGRLDFAQAFIRRDADEPLFDVAVFFGTPTGFSPPVWVERRASLKAGDLTIDRTIVVITPDLEDDAARRYRWDRATSAFVDADGGGGDDELPEDPGNRPRSTA